MIKPGRNENSSCPTKLHDWGLQVEQGKNCPMHRAGQVRIGRFGRILRTGYQRRSGIRSTELSHNCGSVR